VLPAEPAAPVVPALPPLLPPAPLLPALPALPAPPVAEAPPFVDDVPAIAEPEPLTPVAPLEPSEPPLVFVPAPAEDVVPAVPLELVSPPPVVSDGPEFESLEPHATASTAAKAVWATTRASAEWVKGFSRIGQSLIRNYLPWTALTKAQRRQLSVGCLGDLSPVNIRNAPNAQANFGKWLYEELGARELAQKPS
jgi:hypothetical protein